MCSWSALDTRHVEDITRVELVPSCRSNSAMPSWKPGSESNLPLLPFYWGYLKPAVGGSCPNSVRSPLARKQKTVPVA